MNKSIKSVILGLGTAYVLNFSYYTLDYQLAGIKLEESNIKVAEFQAMADGISPYTRGGLGLRRDSYTDKWLDAYHKSLELGNRIEKSKMKAFFPWEI